MKISPLGLVLGSAALCAVGAITAFMIPGGEPGADVVAMPVPANPRDRAAVITPVSGRPQSAMSTATIETASEEPATPAMFEGTSASSVVGGSTGSEKSKASTPKAPSKHSLTQEESPTLSGMPPQAPIERLRLGSQNVLAAENSISVMKDSGKAGQAASREDEADNLVAKANRTEKKQSVAGEAADSNWSKLSPSNAPRAEEPSSTQAGAPRPKRQWPRGNFTAEEERERAQYGWQAFADRVFDASVSGNPP